MIPHASGHERRAKIDKPLKLSFFAKVPGQFQRVFGAAHIDLLTFFFRPIQGRECRDVIEHLALTLQIFEISFFDAKFVMRHISFDHVETGTQMRIDADRSG